MGSGGAATLLYNRLLGGAGQAAQLWFDAAVLDKYRDAGAQVVRTDTIGRVKLTQWSLDFGIAESDQADAAGAGSAAGAGGSVVIHVAIGEAHARIPEAERAHWAAHAIALPLSTNYVMLQLSRGHCVDDGDLRSW